jgi:hypothetical protein
MRGFVRILMTLGLTAAIAGCVVAPVGRPVRGYVGVAAPVVVVRPYYGPYYNYRHW